jgi:hypothetical protein
MGAAQRAADAYNAATQQMLREALGTSLDPDLLAALSPEELAELDALILEAEEALAEKSAEAAAWEQARAEKRAAEQRAIDNRQAAADRVSAAKAAKQTAIETAERARVQGLYNEWAASIDFDGFMATAQTRADDQFLVQGRSIPSDYLKQAMRVFSERMQLTSPPAECWANADGNVYSWSIPFRGFQLVVRLDPSCDGPVAYNQGESDAQASITIQQGASGVLPPGGTLFLSDIARLAVAAREYSDFGKALSNG